MEFYHFPPSIEDFGKFIPVTMEYKHIYIYIGKETEEGKTKQSLPSSIIDFIIKMLDERRDCLLFGKYRLSGEINEKCTYVNLRNNFSELAE